jgi:DNA repair exonuclease SbcCD ATPase subunit
MFSYGDEVTIEFNKRVTQLVGSNGHGKSSIPTILEELLYNKNSRGIKKGDVLNKYKSDPYGGSVYFTVDGDDYVLTKEVGKTKTKVVLTKNGEDISGHTATQTYKTVQDIIKMDFTTFTKLVYQSMTSSLDFLSATDANRKKFLGQMLGLDEYEESLNVLKEELRVVSADLLSANSELQTYKTLYDKEKDLPDPLEEVEVPNEDHSIRTKIADLKDKLSRIKDLNQEIEMKNRLISELANLKPVDPVDFVEEDLITISNEHSSISSELHHQKLLLTKAKSELDKVLRMPENCHVCGSPLDTTSKEELKRNFESEVESISAKVTQLSEELDSVSAKLDEQKALSLKHAQYKQYLARKSDLESRVGSAKVTQPYVYDDMVEEIAQLEKLDAEQKAKVQQALAHNTKAASIRDLIEYKKKKLKEYEDAIDRLSTKVTQLSSREGKLKVLTDAFSSKGLIAYKLETMVKSFEGLINEYLQVLSDGQFNLTFIVDGSKLALNVFKDGSIVDIKSLSSGEFSKVNTATLLAVRKILTAISKNDINVLFLDEVVSVLDDFGKNTLIELLLNEHSLNTFIVSHGFTHPLADVINVIKENNISRLEYGE